ncbi:MAG: AtpZ/AtpI family protein [Lachnospiraceae bacterium]|nr:AtpZ/AtpI family protein [Lachnospiraceae bacterium]
MAGRQKYDRTVFMSLALISQFGITMIVPVAMMFAAGYLLDRYLGTSYWTVILFFVGALAGFRNIYVLARRVSSEKKDGEA